MGLLSSLKQKVGNFANTVYDKAQNTSLGKIFLPDTGTASQRRVDTFGTDSKLVATGAVVGAGALAIAVGPGALGVAARSGISKAATAAAPVLAGGGRAIATGIGQAATRAPVATALGVGVGIPVIAGAIISNPKVIVDLPKAGFDLGRKLGDFTSENPGTAALIGAAGLVGGTLAAAKTFGEDTDVNINTPTPIYSAPAIGEPVSAPAAGGGPIVPQGPATTSLSTTRKRRKAKVLNNPVNIRNNIQIINAPRAYAR